MKQTCPNCGSDDIVDIQGQSFCINCGHQQKGSKTADPEVVAMVEAEVNAAPVKTRKAAAKPKAKPKQPKKSLEELVDAGTPEEVTPVVVNKPKPQKKEVEELPAVPHVVNSPTKSSKIIQPLHEIEVPGTVEEDSESDTDQASPQIVKQRAPRLSEKPKKPVHQSVSQQKEDEPFGQPDSDDAFADLVQKEDIQAHPIGFSLKLGLALATPITAAVTAGLWFRVDYDVMLLIVGISLVLVISMLSLTQAAMIYGLSRIQDHRPSPRKQWWAAARGGFLDMINVDLTVIIKLLILGALSLGAWQGIQPLQLDGMASAAILVLVNSLLSWLAIGVIAARHIAIPAVIIGGLSSTTAMMLGWRLYVKAGASLAIALIETWLVRIVVLTAGIAAFLYASRLVGSISHEIVTALVGASVFVGITVAFVVALQLEARVWLKQYRYWVGLYLPKRRLRLLTGRIQAVVRR